MIEYQVGGSLAVNNPTYIKRQADDELYNALLRGELCYVLTSRQMGKSSLRLQSRHRIESTGQGCCASIDMTRIGSENVTPEQWYRGISFDLLKSLRIYDKVDLSAWWIAQSNLSLVQKLSQFLEEVVLKQIPDQKIFIFIDEIDSVQSLKFPVADFFASIRYCYNQRAENPVYNRLVWALFGVASPSELIADVKRTPFNMGKAIALSGFTFVEAMPLLAGLKPVFKHPQQVLTKILEWTGGQPFLTQKLCALVQQAGKDRSNILPDDEEAWIETIVRSQIIKNWQMQDEPEHLRTIQRFILHEPAKVGRLLSLYQQILLSDTGISLDETYESGEFVPLILSGLVTYREGTLKIHNRIYREVFSLTWVKYHLANLRPYATNLNAWVQSDYRDEAQLLKSQELRIAEEWSRDKHLSDLDYKFLAASQKSDRSYRERRIVEILAILSYRSGNLKPYLQEIAIAVSELLNLDWSVVTLCDGDEEHILASSFDIGEAFHQCYSLHLTVTGYVFKNGCPLIVEDTEACRDYGEAPEGYRSYLGVPLRVSTGELVGTICSFHSTPRKFSEEEVRLASIFAERAASAIENYNLYQKLQEMNEKLEEMNAALEQELIKQRRNPIKVVFSWLKRLVIGH
ncbi:MAG: AAA-like domain-containing protein [Xenococcaceae cyanobacterium MO_188.B19]|nr:AAA-like domain-containing protein [Xenococcaceae cyanobacterium MO_188.B19]